MALFNSTTDTLKKTRPRDRTDRASFSRLLLHPGRKWSGSILSTLEPARGVLDRVHSSGTLYVRDYFTCAVRKPPDNQLCRILHCSPYAVLLCGPQFSSVPGDHL